MKFVFPFAGLLLHARRLQTIWMRDYEAMDFFFHERWNKSVSSRNRWKEQKNMNFIFFQKHFYDLNKQKILTKSILIQMKFSGEISGVYIRVYCVRWKRYKFEKMNINTTAYSNTVDAYAKCI